MSRPDLLHRTKGRIACLFFVLQRQRLEHPPLQRRGAYLAGLLVALRRTSQHLQNSHCKFQHRGDRSAQLEGWCCPSYGGGPFQRGRGAAPRNSYLVVISLASTRMTALARLALIIRAAGDDWGPVLGRRTSKGVRCLLWCGVVVPLGAILAMRAGFGTEVSAKRQRGFPGPGPKRRQLAFSLLRDLRFSHDVSGGPSRAIPSDSPPGRTAG